MAMNHSLTRSALPAWLRGLLLTGACIGSLAAHSEEGICTRDLDPQFDAACRRELAATSKAGLLALADTLLAKKHYQRAVVVLEEAITRHPADTTLPQRLHEARSLADEAAWLARKSEPSATPEPEVDLVLAETRCTRLTGKTALDACERALLVRPADAKLLAARGDLLMTLGRVAEAAADYRAAAAAEPQQSGLPQKLALAEAALAPQVRSIDAELAALEAARDKQLISKSEYERRRAVLLRSAPKGPGKSSSVPDVDFGRYHALVIGIDRYHHLPALATAVRDATAMAEVLRTDYGFDVKLLPDATRADIVEALDEYRARLKASDNLVIYYAGHGWLDTEADKGFWLPVDARQEKRTHWVSNDTVRDALRAMKAKHVLVVADSCFSGTLTRGIPQRAKRDEAYVKRMSSRKARQILSSGGLEPVADSDGNGHSPFAAALLDILRRNEGVLDGTVLFSELRRPVAVNSEQTPQFADIRMTGHQGGDFLFVRRRSGSPSVKDNATARR